MLYRQVKLYLRLDLIYGHITLYGARKEQWYPDIKNPNLTIEDPH